LLQRGLGRIANEAHDAGVDGLLVVDLPPEESGELDDALAAADLSHVPLLAPTTSLERARAIVERASGFAYYVALTGVTGAGHLDIAEVGRRTAELRPALRGLPLAVGFGVRDPASARALAAHADAVVVGSALVQAIAEAPDAAARRKVAYERVRALKDALALTSS
ncbi:MAG: tryptophan synthase subunit alpha, partial [Polyangia bacterium]